MEATPSLYLTGDTPRARTTDPVTSHEGADASMATRVAIQNHVMKLFEHFGAMTDRELTEHYFASPDHPPADPESPRKRRSALTADGLLVDTGLTRRSANGRSAVVWRINTDLTTTTLWN